MFDRLPTCAIRHWFGAIAVIAWCESGWSQTTTPSVPFPSSQTPTRSIPRTTSSPSRDSKLQLTISREDCSNPDLSYHFEVDVAGATDGSRLQAWAGRGSSDCAAQHLESDAWSGCYLVGELNIQGSTATGDFTAAQLLGVGTTSSSRIMNSCDDCLPPAPGPSPNPLQVTFLLLGNGVQRVLSTQQLYYALVGPWVPKDPSAEADRESLYITWNMNGSGSADHFRFYCAQNQNELGWCSSSELEPYSETAMRQAQGAQEPSQFYASWICGQPPPTSMVCGHTLDGSMRGLTDATLTDGKSYAVAVAGVDAYGNVGPLTDPVCATPSARAVTHRFPPTFMGYPLAGDAGGCALVRLRRSSRTSQLLLIFGFFAMLRRRIGRLAPYQTKMVRACHPPMRLVLSNHPVDEILGSNFDLSPLRIVGPRRTM